MPRRMVDHACGICFEAVADVSGLHVLWSSNFAAAVGYHEFASMQLQWHM